MSGITVIEKEPFEQSWALKIAVGVYILFLLVYACWFSFQISDSAETWGQFGDYVGGAINPIVGLITIWLLTASLKQSREEMLLTRQALDDAKVSQQDTEEALRDQIKVSEHARDISNTIALWNNLKLEIERLKGETTMTGYVENAEDTAHIRSVEETWQELGAIMDAETT